MKNFFKDIFEYQHYFNQELLVLLLKYENQLDQRILEWICHAINAHNIWNGRINGEPDFEVFQMHTLEECQWIDHKNFIKTFSIIDQFDLKKQITYYNSLGKRYENYLQDILFHIVNHFTHHKAQIVLELRSLKIEPPVMDFIFYKRSKKQST